MAKRVIFVTVGTTALEAKRLPEWVKEKQVKDYLKLQTQEERENHERAWPELFTDLVRAHEELWACEGRPVGDALKETAAELTSTHFLLNKHFTDPAFRPGRDLVVLLASDTAECKLSARVVASLMCRFRLGCKCGQDFAQFADCRSVKLRLIAGLEAGEFRGVTTQVEEFIAEFVSDGDAAWFNITGGFKGTIPSIVYCAMDLRNWQLIYQHVSLPGIVTVKPGTAGTQLRPPLDEEMS